MLDIVEAQYSMNERRMLYCAPKLSSPTRFLGSTDALDYKGDVS